MACKKKSSLLGLEKLSSPSVHSSEFITELIFSLQRWNLPIGSRDPEDTPSTPPQLHGHKIQLQMTDLTCPETASLPVQWKKSSLKAFFNQNVREKQAFIWKVKRRGQIRPRKQSVIGKNSLFNRSEIPIRTVLKASVVQFTFIFLSGRRGGTNISCSAREVPVPHSVPHTVRSSHASWRAAARLAACLASLRHAAPGNGGWLGRTGWVWHPTSHLVPGQAEHNKASGGEAPGNAMPSCGAVCAPFSSTEQTNPAVQKNCKVGGDLTKRCLWCKQRTKWHRRIREDFRVGFPPPPSMHHAHLSLLSQNWRITPQSWQANHTLNSIRNNGNRFFIKMQVQADFSNNSSLKRLLFL